MEVHCHDLSPILFGPPDRLSWRRATILLDTPIAPPSTPARRGGGLRPPPTPPASVPGSASYLILKARTGLGPSRPGPTAGRSDTGQLARGAGRQPCGSWWQEQENAEQHGSG